MDERESLILTIIRGEPDRKYAVSWEMSYLAGQMPRVFWKTV
jgi:hypothetical protein